MKVAIFDDDVKGISTTKKEIENFLLDSQRAAEISTFSDSNLLLEAIEGQGGFHIIFMDILVENEATGIVLAKKINELYEEIEIVFLTGYMHYATEVYDARHFYFVLKEELRLRLPKVFAKWEQRREAIQSHIICIKEKGYELILDEKSIIYMEREKRKTFVYCENKVYEITKKLSEVEVHLQSKSFVRCHNSFLINLKYIMKLKRTSAILKNGQEIPISRAWLGAVRKKFLEWSDMYI